MAGMLRRGWRRGFGGPGEQRGWGGGSGSGGESDAEAQEKRGEARTRADWREEAAPRWASAGSEWTRASERASEVP